MPERTAALSVVQTMLADYADHTRDNEDESGYAQGYSDALTAVETALTRALPLPQPPETDWQRERRELVEKITDLDYWGARSRNASRRTAENIVSMLEREGRLRR